MGIHSLSRQGLTLTDTETMLLIRDNQSKIPVINLLLDQRIGADYAVDFALADLSLSLSLVFGRKGSCTPSSGSRS